MSLSFAVAPRPRLALFTTTRGAVTETFIKAHIERLHFDTEVFYGFRLFLENATGQSLFPLLSKTDRLLRRLAPRLAQRIATAAVTRLLRETRADAVLAEYGTTGAFLAPACQALGIPLVVHFHGYDASGKAILDAYGRAYLQMFRGGAAVVVVSQAMHKALLALGAEPTQLHLNTYGVDPQGFSAAKPAQSGVVFLAVGRFVPKKSPKTTLRAFAQVLPYAPTARLEFIGEGPLLRETQELAEELGVEANVVFHGAMNPEQVQDRMKHARAFVQHSVIAPDGDTEGAPVAIIEAQMSGLPVIATRHAGIPEVVVDRVTGFLVDEHDTKSMAEKMLQLALDGDLASSFGAAARQRALEKFTIMRHIEILENIIRDQISWSPRNIAKTERSIETSPFGGGAVLIRKFSRTEVVGKYLRQVRIDVEDQLPADSELAFYRCARTGYGFWRPEGMAGSERLYRALMNNIEDYYKSERWEFHVAASRVHKGEACLEIGCGRGHFLAILEKRIDDVEGLELNEDAIRSKVCRSPVHSVTLSKSGESGGRKTWDRIFMFHVLEHIEDPVRFLRSCVERLRLGGRLVISVPNDVFVEFAEYRDALNLPPHHVGSWNVEVFRKVAPILGTTCVAAFCQPPPNSRFARLIDRFGIRSSRFKGPAVLVELIRVS